MQADLQICISVPLLSYSWRYTSKKVLKFLRDNYLHSAQRIQKFVTLFKYHS